MAKTLKPLLPQSTPGTQPVGDSQTTATTGPVTAVTAAVLDLTAFRLPQAFGNTSGVKKVITTIPVRKPGNQTYIRVRPGEEWQLPSFILQLKEDGECYFVMPDLYAELAQEAKPKVLYTYVTRDGNVGLWPVNLPGDDGRLDSWSQSAHSAAQIGQRSWVRLVANRTVGAYDVMEAANLADEPVWPELSFKEILALAFRDRLITSMDHPIVRRLRGDM